MYAVVNRKKIKPETDVRNYCSISSSDERYTDNTNLTDSNPATNYQTTPDTFAQVSETMLDNNELFKTNNTKQRINCKPFLLTCLVILITAVVIITLAAVVVLVVIVDLKSELDSVKNRNVGQNNLKRRLLHQLQVDFLSFYSSTSDLLVSISQKTFKNVSIWRQQANFTIKMIQNFGDKISLLRMTIHVLNDRTNQKISHVENETSFVLQNLKQEVSGRISNITHNLQTTIKKLSEKLVRSIQTFHTFNSCASVFNLSIQLPSGKYMIRSGNSVRGHYCNSTCNGRHGGWKRIAYLNTDDKNPLSCPSEFEIRADTSDPPLCRRANTSAGCSSVTYPTNSMSYSQVCGTVRVHPAGTPDGFIIFDDTSVNVDGVYLTYGDSSNRNHTIWTYIAIYTESNTRGGCGRCNDREPSNMPGTNFTCTTAYCNDTANCYSNTLWGSEAQQCFGNETFYRQLSESTTDDIEMRVCRDQGRDDEDILISLVELFIK